jgi:ATP synthase F1 delta subunit
MNSTNKAVITYAKALFQNSVFSQRQQPNKIQKPFVIDTITSPHEEDQKTNPGDMFTVGEELLLFKAVLSSSEKLEEYIKNPVSPEKEKLELLLDIFPGIHSKTKSFLKILTEKRHLFLIAEISEEYNKLLLKFQKFTKIKLTTGSILPIEEKFGRSLFTALEKLTNSSEIILNLAYDPTLLGGLILEYNSVTIDASLLKEVSLFFNEI